MNTANLVADDETITLIVEIDPVHQTDHGPGLIGLNPLQSNDIKFSNDLANHRHGSLILQLGAIQNSEVKRCDPKTTSRVSLTRTDNGGLSFDWLQFQRGLQDRDGITQGMNLLSLRVQHEPTANRHNQQNNDDDFSHESLPNRQSQRTRESLLSVVDLEQNQS